MKKINSSFILLIGILISLSFLGVGHAETEDQVAAVEKVKKELVKSVNAKWIREYETYLAKAKEAAKRGEFSSISPPKSLKPFKDWDYYYLDGSGMWWFPNEGQEFESVNVPIGFVTDLASIPQILWSFGIRPEGSYAYAAVIHDYLYWTQGHSREEADLIFLYAMEDSHVDASLRKKIYKAVRLAGGSSWENNRKNKQQGARRILQKFPPDFTITWEEWEKTPGVFAR